MQRRSADELKVLARGLQILLLDVDGVMTDGGIILMGESAEAKRFDVQDGMGVRLAQLVGLRVAIVTSRHSEVVDRRAKELKMDEVYQGIQRKPEVLDLLFEKYKVSASQAAFLGDDIQDISIMRLVGIPIAVGNAVPAVQECSAYVTSALGGHGAVREAVEWLLELRGEKDRAYRSITG